MNEFNAQTGGRYVYVDDVLNLQELALSFGRIFDECDNFIVSGCKVTGNSISSGYVYLNGKIRKFSGASNINNWPQHIYEKNTTENVHYASGDTKVGRNVYGVAIGASVPTSLDPITQKTPSSITIPQTGGPLMKDVFFGKYALILNPTNLMQVVNGSIKVQGDIEVVGSIKSLNNQYSIIGAQRSFNTSFRDGKLTIETKYESSNNRYSVSMENGVGFIVSVNDTQVSKTDASGMYIKGIIQSNTGLFGSFGVSSNNIYNSTEATDTASLDINMVGFSGGSQYFRKTKIGNGKGSAILTVDGQSNSIFIAGTTTISSGQSAEGLVFLLNKTRVNTGLKNFIAWKDSNAEAIGTIGYTEDSSNKFVIKNEIADLHILGAQNSFVDIGPSIKENGVLLSDKYVLKQTFDTTIKLFAKSSDVYKKTESDMLYGRIKNGFSDYITESNTKEHLRQQIGAIGSTDLSNYALKGNYLSDMAVSEEDKAKIRANIGAVGPGDLQTKLKDSGWIMLKQGLYIRQIGNVVSIQGELMTIHSGILFTIPNTIEPPAYSVYQSISFDNSRNWAVSISGGTRNCKVLYCNGSCGNKTDFSITYMA